MLSVRESVVITEADITDPIGNGMDAYLKCARRIHDLVRLRFDEFNLKAA